MDHRFLWEERRLGNSRDQGRDWVQQLVVERDVPDRQLLSDQHRSKLRREIEHINRIVCYAEHDDDSRK